MKKRLKSYLDNPTGFKAGLALYIQFGGVNQLDTLKKISEKQFISYSDKERLLSELKKIYARLPDVEEAPEVHIPQQIPVQKVEPLVIQNLRKEGISWKKRESYLHALIVHEAEEGTDEERLYNLASEMMTEVQPELNRIYQEIKTWEQTGELPPDEVKKIKKEGVEDYKKMVNMRTRVYRLRALLKEDIDPELKKKYEEEIAEKQRSIEAIQKEFDL